VDRFRFAAISSSTAPSALSARPRRDLRGACGAVLKANQGCSGPLLGPAANPEEVVDRVFWPSCEQREARRRELLVQLEEEQRSDATQIDQKTTGATCEGFETSRQLESGLHLVARSPRARPPFVVSRQLTWGFMRDRSKSAFSCRS